MQTKRSPSRFVLLACLASVTGASAANASAAGPQGGVALMAPDYSLTGSLLGSIVSVQRNNVSDADHALYAAVMQGYRDPDFVLMALRFAAMDAGPDSAARAVTLAKLMPQQNLARIILGTAAFRDRHWKSAEGFFSLHSKETDGLLRMAGRGLRDWCHYGANPANGQEDDITLSQGAIDPVTWLALLQQARIASLRNEARTDSLFAQLDRSAAAVPPLLRVQALQFEAGWLAFRHHDAESRQKLQNVGSLLPAFQLVARRLRPGRIGSDFSPSWGLAEFYIGVTALLGDTTAHDGGNAGAPSPDDDKLKDLRQLKILLLRQALFLYPDLTLGKILLAEELRNDGQLDMAQSALDGVAEEDPLAPLSAHAQAQVALKRHDLNGALHALERVVKANPDNADILNELGAVQDQLGHSEAAIETFTHALNQVSVMESRVWPLLLGRAIAWDHLKRRDKAQADLDRALALAPSEPVLLNYAGYSDVEHDERPEQALLLLRHAMDMAPDDAEIRDSYAWALLKQKGDLAQALPLLLSAVNAAPADAEIAYHLGVAYWYQGRQLEARDQWSQALNNKPEPETKALIDAALAGGPDLPVMRGRAIPSPR